MGKGVHAALTAGRWRYCYRDEVLVRAPIGRERPAGASPA